MTGIEEITASILGPRTTVSEATEKEIRSLGEILALHQYLLARGWQFESVETLVIWIWPDSQIPNDDIVPSTDVWVALDHVADGPECIDIEMSLVGEPDTYEDEWTLRFPLMTPFDELPLESDEAYRFGDPLPTAWEDKE
ncbi:hypothetical protein [Microbacterium algeriense]|uniref:hypothetical protein n=1 Tax=Microbacterium algeriense TaxID=2615184 RepID=UPI0022E92410|nr:hypothetical protein [Microbacterium algeriense]